MRNRKPRPPQLPSGATRGPLLIVAVLAVAVLAGGASHAARAQQPSTAAAPGQSAPAGPSAPSPGEASAASAGDASSERVNDYPTLARVEYVFECLSDNRGPAHEMLYKCVCAADRIAASVPYERWVELSTFFKAQPIAGERGAYVRERADIRAQLNAYRDLQLDAKKACFIPIERH